MVRLSFVCKNIMYNIKYLCGHNLYYGDNYQKLELLNIIDWNWGAKKNVGMEILTQEETVDLLLRNPKSFCRFGDGEVDIMEGKSIPFQKYSVRLAKCLEEILKIKHEDLYIGVNYYYYNDCDLFNEHTSNFYKLYGYKFGNFFSKRCNRENVYIDAAFNQIYQCYEEYDFEGYYNKIKSLFSKKKIVVFSGEGVLNKLQHNLFEEAEEIIYEIGPSKDAFEQYEELLSRAEKYEKEYLLCFILGPASKVLVYELCQKGYCAWDIGHMAKDYNSYMQGEVRTAISLKNFYAPD